MILFHLLLSSYLLMVFIFINSLTQENPEYKCSNFITNGKVSGQNRCSLGYVPDVSSKICQPVDDFLLQHVKKYCPKRGSYGMQYLFCVNNNVEYYGTRKPNDSCSDSNNCALVYDDKQLEYFVTECKNSTCVYAKPDYTGQTEANCLNGCYVGYDCFNEKCYLVSDVLKQEGDACGVSPEKVLSKCVKGAYCHISKEGSSTGICRKYIPLGGKCQVVDQLNYCADGLTCRKENANSEFTTCQKPANLGEHCDIASDCYSKYNFYHDYYRMYDSADISCAGIYKICIRNYSLRNGESCKYNFECWSGYCNSDLSICEIPKVENCTKDTDCKADGAICACNGDLNSGRCVDSCIGLQENVVMCIYNSGYFSPTLSAVQSMSIAPSLDNQFYDPLSGYLGICKEHYDRYYSCLTYQMEKQGITTRAFGKFDYNTDIPFDSSPMSFDMFNNVFDYKPPNSSQIVLPVRRPGKPMTVPASTSAVVVVAPDSNKILAIVLGTVLPVLFIICLIVIAVAILIICKRNDWCWHESPSPTSKTTSHPSGYTPISPTGTTSIYSKYSSIKLVGSGSFGSVYRVKKVNTKEKRALKTITFVSDEDLNRGLREFSKLININHEHIIKVYDIFVDTNSKILGIEMDYYKKGDLLTFLKSNSFISEKVVAQVLFQITLALKLLSSYNVIHRDIKPSNIFVKNFDREDDNICVLLGDFGLAKSVDTSSSFSQIFSGTPLYMSPELLNGIYNVKSDIFALGVSIYQLMTHDLTSNINSLFVLNGATKALSILENNMKDVKAQSGYSNELIDIVLHMLDYEYEKRPTPNQLTDMNYFAFLHQSTLP
ncbi:hypothetical protein ABK040_001153 [Willaertia magna]